MSAQIDKTLFRTYDIRGIVDDTLTPETVELIGQAIGTTALQAKQDTVVIARDGRLSGPTLLKALEQGILSSGCNVINLGAAPTPVLYFATYFLGKASGAMLTGSHNPANYNGIKMVIDGKALSGDAIQALYQLIVDDQLLSSADPGNSTSVTILDDYLHRITSDVKLKKPLKIVIDCGNGIAGCIAPDLYRALGCEVVELFCDVDGHFPNHHPDPSQTENLQDLIAAVKTHQADIGLAFDGDADRLGVVTPKGQVIWPDRQLILFAKDILQRKPGSDIIYDVKCTRYVPTLVKQFGGNPIICPTGHSLVKAKLKETGAEMAGEFSGHLFFKDRWYGFDDGLYAGARLLEILANTSKTADALFAEIPDCISTPELRIPVTESDKFNIMQTIVDTAVFDTGTVSKLDGIRVDFDNGFGLIRASNTSPYLICRFEADDAQALADIQEVFKAQLQSMNLALSLPF